MAAMFDQLGGLEKLVRNKTVTVKVNMTGPPENRFQGLALGLTHYTHPKVVGATANLLGRAGARRIRFVESSWATAGPLEDVILDAGWNLRALQIPRHSLHVPRVRDEPGLPGYRRIRQPGQAQEPRRLRRDAFVEELFRLCAGVHIRRRCRHRPAQRK